MALVYKNGIWQEGKAVGELLREDLRALPSDLVTKDPDDEKRVHSLDPEHIQNNLRKDWEAEQRGDQKIDEKEAIRKLPCAQPGEVKPISQWEVDVIKARTIAAMFYATLGRIEATGGVGLDLEQEFRVRHLWFPTKNVNYIFLREGNPPSKKQRPDYLREIDLVVDFRQFPDKLRSEMRKRGVELPRDLLQTALNAVQKAQKTVMLTPDNELVTPDGTVLT